MAKQKSKSTAIEDLTELKAHFDNKYGKGAVRFAGDNAIVPVDSVPTGVVSIDEAIGCKGIPRGRIIEIYGPESSGKTTTCLKIGAAFQNTMFDIKDENGNVVDQRKGRVAMVDVEHAFDPKWATAIGMDVGELIFSQPDHGEQAYDIVEMICKSGKVELIILDSIAAMATKEEIEGTLEESNQIGAQARLNSKALRKLKGIVADHNCTLMCVNQIREKIGVMFGSPETTPGGKALKFYASVRMDIRRTGSFKVGDTTVGNTTKVTFKKNKVAPPFTVAEFNITFGLDEYPISGVDPYSSLIELGKKKKILTQAGSHVKYEGESLGNGLAASAAALATDPNLFQKIYSHVVTGMPSCPTQPPSMNEETPSTSENPPQSDS